MGYAIHRARSRSGLLPALGRSGTPEDLAAAVVFLCAPQASWLTGEVLDLDLNGGAHLKRYPAILGHVMKLAQA
nr:SDR family oxidoreductase [Streptomyces sp. DSM 41633]